MPDPEFTGDGGVISMGPAMASGEQPTPADNEEMEAAQEACQPIMEEARGSLPPMDPEEQEEMRRNALEFSECMREHGIDFPDPVFNDDGGVSISLGGGADSAAPG
ncbi:MAG: hypothetical protein M3527_09650, partial [Actinomycetota bacterium]|nr:hypothetical protein [Actinomycetota bacterium]